MPEVTQGVSHTHPTLEVQVEIGLGRIGEEVRGPLQDERSLSVLPIRHLTLICDEGPGRGALGSHRVGVLIDKGGF